MKKLIAFTTALLLLSTNAPAFAEIEIEDGENLPPPMTVTYEYTAPSAVIVEIPAYTTVYGTIYAPVKTTGTFPPIDVPTSSPDPTPLPTPPAEVKGDYAKGTVYGPSLSAKELKQLKAKVGEIITACIHDGMSEREKIVALVNYVYAHCSYAPDWSKNRANTAWGLLVYGKAQCSGYARGMVALFDAVGIESRYVHAAKTDPVNPSHQWNLVKLDGKWYHLDVQMIDSSYGEANKPILLMSSHLTYDTSKLPMASGESVTLQ